MADAYHKSGDQAGASINGGNPHPRMAPKSAAMAANRTESYADGGADDMVSLRSVRTADMRLSIAGSMAHTALAEGLLGPARPRPHKIWRKKFIKVLVVGDSGLGKTTLIKTLLSTPGERLSVHDGTSTPTEVFVKDPESLCSTVTWKDEEDRVIWVYRVQDTPGYGDDMNLLHHVGMIKQYIHSQNMKWLNMEQHSHRGVDMSEVEDPRVDVCLFCVPPHRLRPVDLRYMYELSKAVPIIPVITKCDTMTIREAQIYKQEVYTRLQNPQMILTRATRAIHGKINVFTFDKETLARSGVVESQNNSMPPFLIVASNDINEEMNHCDPPVFWPERRYPWGTAEAFNPEHSDLLTLRALLLKEALEDIASQKRQRYEDWRAHALGAIKTRSRFRSFVFFTVAPVAAALYFASHGFDIKSVKEELRGVFGGKKKNKQAAPQQAQLPPMPVPVAVAEPPAPEPAPEPVAPVAPPPAPVAPPAPVYAPAPQKKGWFQ